MHQPIKFNNFATSAGKYSTHITNFSEIEQSAAVLLRWKCMSNLGAARHMKFDYKSDLHNSERLVGTGASNFNTIRQCATKLLMSGEFSMKTYFDNRWLFICVFFWPNLYCTCTEIANYASFRTKILISHLDFLSYMDILAIGWHIGLTSISATAHARKLLSMRFRSKLCDSYFLKYK